LIFDCTETNNQIKLFGTEIYGTPVDPITPAVLNLLLAPNSSVKRQDLTVIIHRFAAIMKIKLPVNNEQLDFSDDKDIAGYAKEAVYALQQTGIFNAETGEPFDPNGAITRAEVAAILRRFVENVQ
jgi:hypothetical protein